MPHRNVIPFSFPIIFIIRHAVSVTLLHFYRRQRHKLIKALTSDCSGPEVDDILKRRSTLNVNDGQDNAVGGCLGTDLSRQLRMRDCVIDSLRKRSSFERMSDCYI